VSVRVYVPTTSSGLAAVVAEGRLAGPFRAHAVTDELRSAWPDADEEQWEYAAMYAAADASLALVSSGDVRRRFVIAADVPTVSAAPGEDPTLVHVAADVPWKNIASAHADTADIDADTADDTELAWFATQEIRYLVD